jgi:hypothetical protein
MNGEGLLLRDKDVRRIYIGISTWKESSVYQRVKWVVHLLPDETTDLLEVPKKKSMPARTVLPSPDLPSTPHLACHYTHSQSRTKKAAGSSRFPFLTSMVWALDKKKSILIIYQAS